MHLCLRLPHVCRQERPERLASALCWLLHCGGQFGGAGFVCWSQLPHRVGSSEYCRQLHPGGPDSLLLLQLCSYSKIQVLHRVKIVIKGTCSSLFCIPERGCLGSPQSPGAPWECNWLMHRGLISRRGPIVALFLFSSPPSLLAAVTNGPAGLREAGLSGEEGRQRGCWLWPAFLPPSVCWCVCPLLKLGFVLEASLCVPL